MCNRENILDYFKENEEVIENRLSDTIEKYRKGLCKVKVVDKCGNPIQGAKLNIVQKNHSFKYGANIFMLDELESDEKNQLYKKYFSECCNIATLPFYWKDIEPEKGKYRFEKGSPKLYRRPAIDLCMEFCKQNSIEPKLHCLNYDSQIPEWLSDESVEVIKLNLENHIKTLSERYSNDINYWEVTNETLFSKLHEKTTSFYHEPDFVEWSFKTARKYLSNNKLVINDGRLNIFANFNYNRSAYYMQIERALRKGAEIDAVGMQYHMFARKEDEEANTKRYYDPNLLYAVMDTYSDFGKPLHLTEVTIPAYSYEPDDEDIQARIIEYLYKIWFSHPNVEQIVYWNLVDGYAAFAQPGDMNVGENYYYGGLVRFDMTPKPAYYVIKNMFDKVWHTEKTVLTDENGFAEFKGFYGDYSISICDNDTEVEKCMSICKNADNEFEIVV